MPVKITKEMIENWLGTDTDIPELLSELANGEYTPEQFTDDIIDSLETFVAGIFKVADPSTENSNGEYIATWQKETDAS